MMCRTPRVRWRYRSPLRMRWRGLILGVLLGLLMWLLAAIALMLSWRHA